jgi:hypothetical protein
MIGALPVESIDLTIDGRAEIWRTATIQIGVDFWETETREFLEEVNVQTGEVTIEHGIKWTPADEVHWVQIARLRVDQLSMTLLAATRQVVAFDRALLLGEHGLPTARPLNAPYTSLIATMLHETLPGEPLVIAPGVSTTLRPAAGKSLSLGSNRLSEIIRLAQSANGIFHNTNLGGFHIMPYDDDPPVVWEVNDGVDGVVINLTQDFSRAEQYNAVGIEYTPMEGSTAEWSKYVYAWDNEPTSPTFYDGPFGKRNIFFSETYDHLPTDTEAVNLARRKLAEYTGATRGLAITCAYNPLLQPGDGVAVSFPEAGTVEDHIVEAISLNLGVSAQMTIETRLKRLAADILVSNNSAPGGNGVVTENIVMEDA